MATEVCVNTDVMLDKHNSGGKKNEYVAGQTHMNCLITEGSKIVGGSTRGLEEMGHKVPLTFSQMALKKKV